MQDWAYRLYRHLCICEVGMRVGFSSKTKAKSVIRDIIHLLQQDGKWTGGLLKFKYGLLDVRVTLQVIRSCTYWFYRC